MKHRIAILIILLATLTPSCTKKGTGALLDVREIDILETRTYPGAFIGSNLADNEIFTRTEDYDSNQFVISIIDIDAPEIPKLFKLPIGDSASPTEFALPTHLRRLDGKLCIADAYSKTVVLDNHFNQLYSGMFNHINYFIDYFQHNGELLLLVGYPKIGEGQRLANVELYTLQKNKPPVLKKTLDSIPIPILPLGSNTGKEVQFGPIWPTVRGFEKQGKIYWSCGSRNYYSIYDIATGAQTTVQLPYLIPKRFTQEEINQLGDMTIGLHKAKLMKRVGRKIIYIPYEAPFYHLGLHDLGPNQIGIIANLDIPQKKFRLDIIDQKTGRAVSSIHLPAGYRFLREISDKPKGLPTMAINIPNGLYTYCDIKGEDNSEVLRLTRFKTKQKRDR